MPIKINTVALRDVNEDEIADLIAWSHGRGFDLTLIETMPMGEIDGETSAIFKESAELFAREVMPRFKVRVGLHQAAE